MNHDQRKAVKIAKGFHFKICARFGVRCVAKQTSTSGRWISMLCEHSHEGLPCFDVININSEGTVDRHHFLTNAEGVTYDEARDLAKAEARSVYDKVVERLQQKGQTEEKEDLVKGLKVHNPDGSEEDFKYIN